MTDFSINKKDGADKMKFLILTEFFTETDLVKTHVSYKNEQVEADSPEDALLKRDRYFFGNPDPDENDSSRIVEKEAIVVGLFEVVGNEVGRYNHMDWILRLNAQTLWALTYRDRINRLEKEAKE